MPPALPQTDLEGEGDVGEAGEVVEPTTEAQAAHIEESAEGAIVSPQPETPQPPEALAPAAALYPINPMAARRRRMRSRGVR